MAKRTKLVLCIHYKSWRDYPEYKYFDKIQLFLRNDLMGYMVNKNMFLDNRILLHYNSNWNLVDYTFFP